MRVKRIMANIETSDVEKAAFFYGEMLGLDLLMDHGWLPDLRLGRDDAGSGQFCLGRRLGNPGT